MRSQQTLPRSSQLFASLPVALQANITMHLVKSRTLTLRGPYVIISKRTAYNSAKTLLLGKLSQVKTHGNASAYIHDQKVQFEDQATRDSFVKAAYKAIHHATTGIERYHVIREIGHGASGTVFLVQRKKDSRLFAMKTVSKAGTLFNDAKLNCLVNEREALIDAVKRNSPFIVRLVDAFETDEKLCLVTEYAEHGDMSKVIDPSKKQYLSEKTARRMFAEMVLGLENSHRMGYLFRDMKLANLLLNAKGHVKIADFGLATKLDVELLDSSDVSDSDTQSDNEEERFRLVGRAKSYAGTKRYMAPELLTDSTRRREGYGAAADVWALGVTLYLMLTGTYPFGQDVTSKNHSLLTHAICNDTLTFPEHISNDAKDMLSKMLDRDQLERVDLNELKAHAWLRYIDWANVKFEAENDLVQESSLEELQGKQLITEDSVSGTMENMREDNYLNSEDTGRYSEFSCMRVKKGYLELPGFRYINLRS